MRGSFVVGILLILSGLSSILGIRIFNLVIYDKMTHMAIGVIFGAIYFQEFPSDNPVHIATKFAVLYEIFIYIMYTILLLFILREFDELQSPVQFFSNFVQNYTLLDEWFDVVATWLGVILGSRTNPQKGYI